MSDYPALKQVGGPGRSLEVNQGEVLPGAGPGAATALRLNPPA